MPRISTENLTDLSKSNAEELSRQILNYKIVSAFLANVKRQLLQVVDTMMEYIPVYQDFPFSGVESDSLA